MGNRADMPLGCALRSKTINAGLAGLAIALALNSAAFAGSYCEHKYGDAVAATKGKFSPQIEAVYNEIRNGEGSRLRPGPICGTF